MSVWQAVKEEDSSFTTWRQALWRLHTPYQSQLVWESWPQQSLTHSDSFAVLCHLYTQPTRWPLGYPWKVCLWSPHSFLLVPCLWFPGWLSAACPALRPAFWATVLTCSGPDCQCSDQFLNAVSSDSVHFWRGRKGKEPGKKGSLACWKKWVWLWGAAQRESLHSVVIIINLNSVVVIIKDSENLFFSSLACLSSYVTWAK